MTPIPCCWEQPTAGASFFTSPYMTGHFTCRNLRTCRANSSCRNSYVPFLSASSCGGGGRGENPFNAYSLPASSGRMMTRGRQPRWFLRTPERATGFSGAWKVCRVQRRALTLFRKCHAGGISACCRSKNWPQRGQSQRREAVVAGGSVTSTAMLMEPPSPHGLAGGEGSLQGTQ